MQKQSVSKEFELLRRSATIKAFETGILGKYVNKHPYLQISRSPDDAEVQNPSNQELVFSAYELQDAADYRQAIQSWFNLLKIGGNLVIVVPHRP